VELGGASLLLRAAVRYVSPHASSRITVSDAAFGATPYVRVPGRALADLNATLVLGGNISITGYVRNLTNERYLPDNWNVANVIPGNPPTVIVSQSSLSDPRTFGAILNFKF
jgi:iron complex outermembrane receptor protein